MRIHVKLLDFQGGGGEGRIFPLHYSLKFQIGFIFSSFRSNNNENNVDKDFVYL